jgi:RNA polymerase sigma-70 factor (ECF subfamily)
MTDDDDEDFPALLAGAQAGDDDAVRALYTDLHPRLLRFLVASEPRAADDLAAEVWLGVAQGIGRFEGERRDFAAWMFSIARRRLADHRRRAARRRTDAAPPEAFEPIAEPVDSEQLAVGRVDGAAAAALITRLLPPAQAEVVLLRVLADLDVDHVATLLGQTPNWVRVNQHRAMRRLASQLGTRLDVMP